MTEQSVPEIKILVQYTKDLTFENPAAPGIFRESQSAPQVEMNIGLLSRAQPEEGVHEVVIKASARARDDQDRTLFVAEAVYGALVLLRNVPEDTIEPALYVEVPRLLFPFVRRLIGDTVRDGGFPPLMPDMPDFAELYRQRVSEASSAPAAEPAVG